MFCLPGSIPALHPQRPLDPDQPPLHRPHPLPGPPLMDQFRKSEKLLLTGFKVVKLKKGFDGFLHNYFPFPATVPDAKLWEFFQNSFSTVATLASRLHNKECGGGEQIK